MAKTQAPAVAFGALSITIYGDPGSLNRPSDGLAITCGTLLVTFSPQWAPGVAQVAPSDARVR